LSLVFRAVGLIGDGGTGDLKGAMGDLRARAGLLVVVAVEMLRDSLGLADREASILEMSVLI
jgi:hypothetical protein